MYFLYCIGMVLMSISSLVSAGGLVLIKHSAALEQAQPVLQRHRLMLGLLCLTVLPVPLNSVAFSFAPLSLLAPLGGLTIVFALLLARAGPTELQEPIGERSFAAVLVLLLGVCLVTIFGPQSPEAGQKAVQVAVVTCTHNIPFVVLAGLCLSGPSVLLMSRLLPSQHRPKPENASYVVMQSFSAAVCGTFSTLILKILSESTRDLVEGNSFLSRGPMAVCIGFLCFFAPCELYLLQKLIATSPVTFAVPLYESLLIALNVAMGGVFFGEFPHFGVAGAVFSFGIALVGTGVVLLSYEHASSRRNAAETKRSEDELAISLADAGIHQLPVVP